MASRNSLDMTSGPILRKLLLFAYPLVISTLVSTLYDVTDKFIAGKFIGDNAMAAIGATTPLINLLSNFFLGLASGVSVLCGNYIGGKRDGDLRECIHTAPVLGTLCGLLASVVGLFCCKPLLLTTGTPDTIFSDAYVYMAVRMLGLPFAVANNFCLCILTAHGDTKRVTLSGLLSGLVNVLGNVLFVAIIPMGLGGIALATILSQALALSIKLVILFSPKDIYRLRFSKLRFHWRHAKELLINGIPVGLNNIVFSFSNTMLQSSVNSFGPTVIAGNALSDTVFNLAGAFPVQINAACGCAVAQCFGAANYRRIADVVKKGILTCVFLVALAATTMTLFSKPLMMLFTEDPAVAAAGTPKLLFSCWGYLIYSFTLIYSSALKGMRRSSSMLILNTAGICLPRLLWVWFVFPFFASPNMLYLIYPVSYLISACLLCIVYHRVFKKTYAQGLKMA